MGLVAPASPFDRADFEAGVAELRRLGLEPVLDERVFDRRGDCGRAVAEVRAASLLQALDELGADAVIAVRGGYGSVETLPLLDAAACAGPARRLSGTAT